MDLSRERIDSVFVLTLRAYPICPAAALAIALLAATAGAAREHWAFVPPSPSAPPEVEDADWPQSPIDRFILARLEAAGLSPAAPADRRTLIRRATFDLTGLPPTRQEVDAFVADDTPEAFARVVDRLLASPHYGERWGRHWLDVARYADSNGLDENVAQANAWRYRDYVIEALNLDKPYDEFLREQLAGDLLPTDDPRRRNERLIATGFLSLGPKVLAEVDEGKMEMDIVDEQIDVVGRALLGLTLGCARCHDHKFDPISLRDYYALAGIFKSTHTMDSFTKIARWHENALFDEAYERERARHEVQLAAKRSALDRRLAAATAALQKRLGEGAALPAKAEASFPVATREQLQRHREELAAFEKTAPQPPTAMGVKEGAVADVAVHIRGDHLTLGDTIPRRMPAVFASDGAPAIDAAGSGRLALARSLTSPENPLVARVMVNRIWRWHFGRGLVETTDNFGRMGARPTHPGLLDWLATTFVREGWSIKDLHRRIMRSTVYRMSSEYTAAAAKADPQNRRYWRAPLRRLEAEELRDALLWVSRRLDVSSGGTTLAAKNRAFIFDHTSRDKTSYESRRRSVYLPVIRNHLHDSFTLFDYTDASVPNGNRDTSTVASQALYLMNSDFVVQASEQLADRVLARASGSDTDRIRWLYQTTIGRDARDEETARIETYLERFAKTATGNSATGNSAQRSSWCLVCQALLISNEFVYLR